jgi:diguanylate cyclase (GGDEF)-like protein
MLLDVDRFKQINDRQGHLAGDRALARLGAILRSALPADPPHAFRYGGDEFVVLLPGRDAAQSMILAERLRRAFTRGLDDAPGLSIGATELRRNDRKESLISRADQAMYLAKRSGGNRVEVL